MPQNGHVHFTYALATPVLRTARARPKPLALLARISEFYRDRLGADPLYNGVLTHNPMARAHRQGTMKTHWIARGPYTLTHLKSFIPRGWRAPTVPTTEIGRNVGLFKAGCQWAGSPVNQGQPVLPILQALNMQYAAPLHPREVERIARNVEHYRQNWTYYTEAERTLWGQHRGQASGRARRAKTQERDETIRQLAAQGWSQRGMAKHFGMSKTAIAHVLRMGDGNRTTPMGW